MREARDAFHLAIPARDLDEAFDFYVRGLGCKLARRYDERAGIEPDALMVLPFLC